MTAIAVFTGAFTKWTEAWPIPDKSTLSVETVFYQRIMYRFGLPVVVRTDGGSAFRGGFKEMCERWGISHRDSHSSTQQTQPNQPAYGVSRHAVLMTGSDANAWCLHPDSDGPLKTTQWLEVDIPVELAEDGSMRSFARFVDSLDPPLPVSKSSYRSRALNEDRIPIPSNPFNSPLSSGLPHPSKPAMTPSSDDSLDDTEFEHKMGSKPPAPSPRTILEKRKSTPWYVPGTKGSIAQGHLPGHGHGHGSIERPLDSATPSSPVAAGERPASVIHGAAGTTDSTQDCGQADDNGEGTSFDRLTGSTLEIGLDSEAERAASGQFDKGKGRAESPVSFDQGRDSLRQSFNALLIDTAAEHAGLLQQEMAMAVARPSVLQGSACN
ncbi:hypothetical protein BGX31_002022, partial [Mortierella sp. GBA43]